MTGDSVQSEFFLMQFGKLDDLRLQFGILTTKLIDPHPIKRVPFFSVPIDEFEPNESIF